ncbi:MAG: hypothetical protein E7431_09010 [Ruminococcaceae bacterium]|nr:hypothetical protein [Oscillospiraceae bacterium]
MGERIKKYWFPVLSFTITLLAALFWVALRINHSGISKFLGADTNPSFLVMNLPVMVTAAAWIGFGFALAGLKVWSRKKWPAVTAFVIGIVMTVAAVAVIIFGAKDYIRFILPHFWESVAVSGGIIAFGLILLFPPKWKNGLKYALIAAVAAAAVVIGYELRPCTLSYEPVVYAVEDEYQIVFSTSDNAVGWVNIGGKEYYDLYAGSMKSADKVHKITVPQEVLDEAEAYSVNYRQMIYRGPFGGYLGELRSQHYKFRPVDSSDGLYHIAISDVHEAVEAAAAAAAATDARPLAMDTENVDFIVLLGDLVSMVETEKDVQLANELAFKITGGEIPVIYARGNHEIKGEYAEQLYKYVGSKDQQYAYTVTLGDDDVFAVVLDLGEDHEDDWWEYYETAKFDLYRQEQTEMLEDILEEGEYENYRYRLMACHIPVVYVDKHGYFESFRNDWTALLNQMELDIGLSGHKHVLWPLIPGQVEPNTTLVYNDAYSGSEGKVEGGYLIDFNFPNFLVGRRSLEQAGGTQGNGYDQYVCLHTRADPSGGFQISNYVNSEGRTLNGYYPFGNGIFNDIPTDLKRPEK